MSVKKISSVSECTSISIESYSDFVPGMREPRLKVKIIVCIFVELD